MCVYRDICICVCMYAIHNMHVYRNICSYVQNTARKAREAIGQLRFAYMYVYRDMCIYVFHGTHMNESRHRIVRPGSVLGMQQEYLEACEDPLR